MTDFNNLDGRIRWLIKKRAITQRQFAIEVGIDPSNFSRKLLGTQPWTMNDIKKIRDRGVSMEWLKEGVGEPFEEMQDEIKEPTVEKRPRYNVYANAGRQTAEINAYSEPMNVIEQFRKYDFTIQVYGDSMEPTFSSGMEVACLNVNESGFRQWNRPHVLFTTQGVLLKRIEQGQTGYICKSDNPNYPDFEVPEEEVSGIAIVVGSIKLF